jgi:hypothetical protein
MIDDLFFKFGAIAIGALVLTTIAAWITHVVWIIKALMSDAGATGGQMVLGVIGAFMPPIGVIHGFVLWFS